MTARVRPITVLAAAAVVVLIIVTIFSVTRDESTTIVGQPTPLPILVGYGADAAGAPITTSTTGSRTYVAGPDLTDPGDALAAWSVSGGDPDPAAVRRLADAFGVSGDLQQVAGGWQIGADGQANVRVQTSPAAAWTYSQMGQPGVAVVCAGPTTLPVVGPTPNLPDGSSNPHGSDGSVGVDACAPTPAPEAVPSAAEAESLARDLLRRGGLDVPHLRVSGASGDWGAVATATPELDGVATQGLDTVISFGAHGAVTTASGWLAEPTQGDTYPLIGLAAAIDRLNHGQDLLDGAAPMAGIAEDLLGTSGSGGATDRTVASDTTMAETSTTTGTVSGPPSTWGCSVPLAPAPSSDGRSSSGGGPVTTTTVVGDGDAGGSGSGTPSCPTSVCPAPPCPSGAACADLCQIPTCDPAACVNPDPGPTVVPDPADVPPAPSSTTVTITTVDLVLAVAPGSDGSLWLVPAYRLTGDDGSTSTVLAVDESFVADPSGATSGSSVPPTAIAPETVPGSAPGGQQTPATGADPPATGVAPTCTAPWMC